MDPRTLWLVMSGVTLALLAFAALAGREPERIAVAVYVVAWALSIVSHELWPEARPISGVLVADLLLLLAFVRLSWKSARSWPVWAAGVQLIVFVLHFVWTQEPEVGRRGFIAAQNVATLTVLGIMAVGAWRARRAAES